MPNNLRKLLSMRAGSRGPVWLGHKPAFFTGGAVDKSHERFWPGRHRTRPPWCTSERKGQTAGAVRMMTLVDLLRRRGLSNLSKLADNRTSVGVYHLSRLHLSKRHTAQAVVSRHHLVICRGVRLDRRRHLTVSDYFTNSTSPGRHVWSIQGLSGEYMRRITNQLLPGTVSIQLFSYPFGALGPK